MTSFTSIKISHSYYFSIKIQVKKSSPAKCHSEQSLMISYIPSLTLAIIVAIINMQISCCYVIFVFSWDILYFSSTWLAS